VGASALAKFVEFGRPERFEETPLRRHLVSLLVGFLALAAVPAVAAALERSEGVSIHMLPKRVADKMSRPWGLAVDYSPILQPEPRQPVFQTAEELRQFVRKQSASVQENGVWIVTTHPDAYSDAEKQLLESIKSLCVAQHIPLFVVRASELPNGWKRYDQ
jgi:hypothetical protein